MDSLARFFKTRKQPDLQVAPLDEFVIDWVCAANHWYGPSFASMFCMQQDDNGGELYSTIGSSLRSLSVSSVEQGCNGFLEAMAQNAHHLKAKCLKLSDLDDDDCGDLAVLISRTTTLSELELDMLADDRQILASLRCNGTLHSITMLGPIQSRLANGYAARNREVGQLLGNLTTQSDLVDEATDGKDCSKRDRCVDSLVPTLLQVAKQISAARASTALSCLLNLGDSVGSV
jgi:hypothetical protein